MAFSWSTLDKDTPLVRGIPAQFDAVDNSFAQIASLTRHLSDDLHEIRMGQCEGFAGEAANSFHSVIGKIYTSLSDVPRIASDVSIIFRDHSTSLTELREEATSALARAQTRWNDKCRAESEINDYRRQLRSLSSQISALEGSCDPMADDVRARLLSHHSSIGYQLSGAQQKLRTAEHNLNDSRNDWDRIRSNEDTLNEATKTKIDNLTLWSLTDTGNFISERVANFFEGLGDALSGIWDYLVENVLEQLYNILDLFLDALGIIDLVLGWIPIVGKAIMLIEATFVTMKTLTGLALVLAGKMQLNQFLLATAIDLAGVIPGVPRFAVKAIAKTATATTGILIKAGSKVTDTALGVAGRGADIALDVAGTGADVALDVAAGGTRIAGIVVKKSSRVLAKGVKGISDSTVWVTRRVNVSWGRRVSNLGDTMGKNIRRWGDVGKRVADNLSDNLDHLGDDIAEALDNLGDDIADELRGLGNIVDDIGNELSYGLYNLGEGIAVGLDGLSDGVDRLQRHRGKIVDRFIAEVGDEISQTDPVQNVTANVFEVHQRVLDDFFEPIRPDKSPILKPCKFEPEMAVAA